MKLPEPKLEWSSLLYAVAAMVAIDVLLSDALYTIPTEIRGPLLYAILVISIVMLTYDIAGSIRSYIKNRKT